MQARSIAFLPIAFLALVGNYHSYATEVPELEYIQPKLVCLTVRYNNGQDWPTVFGTGFLIHSDGFVLTAKHLAPEELVSDRAQWNNLNIQGRIGDRSSPQIPLKIVDVHKSRDAMLLRLDQSESQTLGSLRLSSENVIPMVQVSAFGFPTSDAVDKTPKVATGFMRGPVGEFGEVNARVSGGFSGGPVVRGREVVGLVKKTSADAEIDRFDFVPIRSIQTWLRDIMKSAEWIDGKKIVSLDSFWPEGASSFSITDFISTQDRDLLVVSFQRDLKFANTRRFMCYDLSTNEVIDMMPRFVSEFRLDISSDGKLYALGVAYAEPEDLKSERYKPTNKMIVGSIGTKVRDSEKSSYLYSPDFSSSGSKVLWHNHNFGANDSDLVSLVDDNPLGKWKQKTIISQMRFPASSEFRFFSPKTSERSKSYSYSSLLQNARGPLEIPELTVRLIDDKRIAFQSSDFNLAGVVDINDKTYSCLYLGLPGSYGFWHCINDTYSVIKEPKLSDGKTILNNFSIGGEPNQSVTSTELSLIRHSDGKIVSHSVDDNALLLASSNTGVHLAMKGASGTRLFRVNKELRPTELVLPENWPTKPIYWFSGENPLSIFSSRGDTDIKIYKLQIESLLDLPLRK